MDADSSTGLNENSESGELDIPSVDSTGGFDSSSKLSATSDRTNPEALDDTAQDTVFSIPEDSNQSPKFKRTSQVVDVGGDHDVLDFEGDDIDENIRAAIEPKPPVEDDDDEEEGELEDDEKPVGSPAGSEEGELEDEPRRKSIRAEGDKDEGEDDDELEEGEVTDDEDRGNKEPKPVCRFFGKGQCTWGSNCRFLHPGVTDKGLYTMFDTMRPLLPIPNNPPPMIKQGLLGTAPPSFAPMVAPDEPPIQESAWERGLRTAKEVIKQSVKRKETDIDFEEKKMNLTLAQEDLDKENDYYIRKPSTPPPAVDTLDDDPYLTRFDPATMAPPAGVGPGGSWPGTSGVRNNLSAKIDPDFVRDRVHRLHKPSRGMREAPPRDAPAPIREAPPLHEPEVRMVRESALRRGGKFPDPSFQGPHGHRRNYEDPRKAEEWRDPWMREKEPGPRKSRKDSNVSKRSSYSSGSSRSSSKSSTSSKSSRSSRSSSRSSKSSKISRSPAAKRRRRSREAVVRKAPPRRISPPVKPVRIAPPPPQDEFGRQPARNFGGPSHFNRPPRFAPSPPKALHSKDRLVDKNNPPLVRERDLRTAGRIAKERKRTWSKRSGSSSRSRSRSNSRSRSPWSKSKSKSRSRSASKQRTRSKFSRDRSVSRSISRSRSPTRRSSHSRSASSSSSSSSSLGSPTLARRRRPTPDKKPEPPAPASKPANPHVNRPPVRKAEPPPKAQIRMTLKPSGGAIRANKNVIERLADDNLHDEEENGGGDRTPILVDDDSGSREAGDNSNGAKSGEKESKQTIKRREELLKQLKAVEDAIAKKRSKLGGV